MGDEKPAQFVPVFYVGSWEASTSQVFLNDSPGCADIEYRAGNTKTGSTYAEYQYKKELLKNGEIADIEINEINQEILNKIKQFVNIIEKRKNDNKKVKYNPEVNVDLTAYILLNGFNMDVRLTPNGWTIGIFVYKNSKVPVMHKFFYEEDIKIIDSNNNHFILKEFDYNENIQNVVEYYLEIYSLIKNI